MAPLASCARGRRWRPIRRSDTLSNVQSPVSGPALKYENDGDVMDEYQVESMLETLWTWLESGPVLRSRVGRDFETAGAGDVLRELERRGLAAIVDDTVSLLPAGEELARLLVRRKRLCEALTHALKEGGGKLEPPGDPFENTLDRDMTDRICTFLGHPEVSPLGKKIPRGRCCDIHAPAVRPAAFPLSQMEPDTGAIIVFINPRSGASAKRLQSLGVTPGIEIALVQKGPSLVLGVGSSTVAVDPGIAREVYVRDT